MSWHYLREPGEESSEAICSGGEPLPPLKSKTTHAEFYCNGKLTESYLDSLSGTTCEHLMADHGAEKSMSSAEDFLAKTLVQPERVQDSMEQGQDFGLKWPESLARFDPVTSSWRTAQHSLFEDSTECLQTLPRWGTTRAGELFQLPTLELYTRENESGYSLPTPTVCLAPNKNANTKGPKTILEAATDPKWKTLWPTPTAQGSKNSTLPPSQKDRDSIPGKLIRDRVIWPTPTTPSGGGNWGGTGGKAIAEKNGTAVPSSINPNLYEWLMGWPIGWTDLKPLEMDKFRLWLEGHGRC